MSRAVRADIAALGASFFDRGLTFGRTGNLSVRLDDEILVTPTGSSLGRLDPDALSTIDIDGKHTGGACTAPRTLTLSNTPITTRTIHLLKRKKGPAGENAIRALETSTTPDT